MLALAVFLDTKISLAVELTSEFDERNLTSGATVEFMSYKATDSLSFRVRCRTPEADLKS